MQTFFLSTVTAEFGPLPVQLAKLTQRTKKCQLRHQDDFFHRGVKTLQKLVEEVQESDLVIHLIGAQPGWCIPADQAGKFLDDEKHTGFESRFTDVVQQARQENLPATQWEAWMGLYFGKRLISFHFQTSDIDDLQNTHLDRLNQVEEHPDSVADTDGLFDQIIGSLITLGVFTAEDIRRPIQLPYHWIGNGQFVSRGLFT